MFKVEDCMGNIITVYAVKRYTEENTKQECNRTYVEKRKITVFLIYNGYWEWVDADDYEPIKE